LTSVPKLLGVDGRKMSKSYDNSINISDRGKVQLEKVSSMFTDPQRMRKSDPGNPEICNVFTFHGLYSTETKVKEIDVECRKAGIGCTDCKKYLAARIAETMAPIHERRDYFINHMEEIHRIIEDGNKKATVIARQTMDEVRAAVKI
jgi:tryptophanyl-tRNA synthetase